MRFTCWFIFYDSLNDFLPAGKRQQWLPYLFRPGATVKDAAEALGVPHVDVNQIRVNGLVVSFSYFLQPDDRIEVFPFETVILPHPSVAFVLDVHLGKLARLLRLLGIDTRYETGYHDAEIAAIAVRENRTVLTRDVGLLKHKVLQYGYWLRSQQPEEQVTEVLRRFSLCGSIQPFSRCIDCNGVIHEVAKENIEHHLPPNTQAFFHIFFQCNRCGKVYWQGSHYENMLRRIEHIRSLACQA